MADEVKPNRPVPPQFLKKKKEKEAELAKFEAEQLPDPPVEIIVEQSVDQQADSKKEIDFQGLVKDLMFNRYFHIMEKEAKPIAEKMILEGSEVLHGVKWFLAASERVQLAKELKEKYGLLK